MDCLEGLKQIPDKSIDLIVTDPPYLIKGIHEYKGNKLGKQLIKYQQTLVEQNLTEGYDMAILDEMYRVMKVPNIYIWCNISQIPMYVKYFVLEIASQGILVSRQNFSNWSLSVHEKLALVA